MSSTDDLEKLLSKLKDEVGPLPPEQPRAQAPAPREFARPHPAAQRFERSPRPRMDGRPGQASGQPGGNMVWSENKEAMLFGMLASLIAVLGGVLAGLDYLVLIGAVVFMMFSFMMLLALFGYYLNFRRSRPAAGGEEELAEKVEALARKIESIGARPAAGGGAGYSPAQPSERERELERKVEELRVIVKTLARGREEQ